MARRHINKLEQLALIKRDKAAERLLCAASAFAEQDLDADVLTAYNKIRNSLQAKLDDVEAGIILWRTNKLTEEISLQQQEQQEYEEVLQKLTNDKSENREEVKASLEIGRLSCQGVIDKLLIFKQIGDLPNRKRSLKKLSNRAERDVEQELYNALLLYLDIETAELNKFIEEEIE